MAGKKGKSGRKPTVVNSKEGKLRLDKLIPHAVSIIEERVKVDKDKEVARWVLEHRLGKATQQIEHSVDESIQTLADIALKAMGK